MTHHKPRVIFLVALFATIFTPDTCRAMLGCFGRSSISNVRARNSGAGSLTVDYRAEAPSAPATARRSVAEANVTATNKGAGSTRVSYTKVAPAKLPELTTALGMLALEGIRSQRRHSIASAAPKAPRRDVPLSLDETRRCGPSILVSPRRSHFGGIEASPVVTPRRLDHTTVASPKSEETSAGSPRLESLSDDEWNTVTAVAASLKPERRARKSVKFTPDTVSPAKGDVFLLSPTSGRELAMLREMSAQKARRTSAARASTARAGAGTGRPAAPKGVARRGSPVLMTDLDAVTSPTEMLRKAASPLRGDRGGTYSFTATDETALREEILRDRINRVNNVLHQLQGIDPEDLTLALDGIEAISGRVLARETGTSATLSAKFDLRKVKEARDFLAEGWDNPTVQRKLIADYTTCKSNLHQKRRNLASVMLETASRYSTTSHKPPTRYSF